MTSKTREFALLVAGFLLGCQGGQALSQRQFTELVVERVEAEYPGILVSRQDDSGFDFARSTGARGRIVTDEEYTYYLQSPDELERLVDRVASLIGDRDRLALDDGGRLRRSLLAVLKPPAFLAEAEARSGGQPLLYGEHRSGLLVFFVVDQPTSMAYLTAGSLGGLGMDRAELTRLAMHNLAHRTGEDRFVVEQTADGPIAVGQTLDGYDAARLISPALLTAASGLVGGASSLVAAVPRRDLILVVPAGSEALRQRISARASAEFHAGPFAITPALFLVDRDGVRPFEG